MPKPPPKQERRHIERQGRVKGGDAVDLGFTCKINKQFLGTPTLLGRDIVMRINANLVRRSDYHARSKFLTLTSDVGAVRLGGALKYIHDAID